MLKRPDGSIFQIVTQHQAQATVLPLAGAARATSDGTFPYRLPGIQIS